MYNSTLAEKLNKCWCKEIVFCFFDYAALKRSIVRSSLHLQNTVDFLKWTVAYIEEKLSALSYIHSNISEFFHKF
jgi:hypothetical protein